MGQVQQACQVSRREQRQHAEKQLVCYHSWKVVTPYNKQILLKSHEQPFEGFQVVWQVPRKPLNRSSYVMFLHSMDNFQDSFLQISKHLMSFWQAD